MAKQIQQSAGEVTGTERGERRLWATLEGVIVGGRYELRAHLATGGMAAVFRGWDYRLKRPVAIKVLRRLESAEPVDVERFRREACATAALHSPNIVEVYDFFEDQGCYYLVMELVGGVTLKQRITADAPLDPYEALKIAAQVCSGLEAAHAAGFVHRDIKPQNILLGTDGSVKLADFGIVHVPWAPGFTTGGIVLGTADYISPEQAQGLPLGPTTDLYSLGVVLYEALTGALPFIATTPVAVAMRHAAEPVVPPRRLNPHIPRDVERVVLRAMRKDPAERYPSAATMAAVLRHVLDISPPHPTTSALPSVREKDGPVCEPAAETGGEWRRLAEVLLRPQDRVVPADEESRREDPNQDTVQGAEPVADEHTEALVAPVPVAAHRAATRRLVAPMALATLLLVGILLLHLLV